MNEDTLAILITTTTFLVFICAIGGCVFCKRRRERKGTKRYGLRSDVEANKDEGVSDIEASRDEDLRDEAISAEGLIFEDEEISDEGLISEVEAILDDGCGYLHTTVTFTESPSHSLLPVLSDGQQVMLHKVLEKIYILWSAVVTFVNCHARADGQWSDWSAWSECCLDSRSRSRMCDNPRPEHGGAYCVGESQYFEDCWGCPGENTLPTFSSWSKCSTKFRGGQKSRILFCNLTEKEATNYRCHTKVKELVMCSEKQYQVIGNWTEWSSWGLCRAPCGSTGIQIRTRSCTNTSPDDGVITCPGDAVESKTCIACPDASNSSVSPKSQMSTEVFQLAQNEIEQSQEETRNGHDKEPLYMTRTTLIIVTVIGCLSFIGSTLLITAIVFR
ncbi:SCO-spondin-like [Saccostrea cucullata]|uniref:SCO-spondin-like n=1 Tax=Saccostrea cuccullata TaxID=36930 RepID=UPI002ED4D62B